MITNKQRKFLQSVLDGEFQKRDNPQKYLVYMNRIRERIDTSMENGVWLAINCPEILKDEYWEIQELGSIKRVRLKKLLHMIKGMYPDKDPALVRY